MADKRKTGEGAMKGWRTRRAKQRDRLARATAALKESWRDHGDVPFPLYDREARAMASAVLKAVGL